MKTFYASRYKFPTRVVVNGPKGELKLGHKSARADLESALGRQLHKDTIVDKRGGNWRFREP